MAEHCRLCASDDLDAAIEHVAEQLWESRRVYDDPA